MLRLARLPAVLFVCLSCARAAFGAGQTELSNARDAYARAIELESRGNQSGALALLWHAAGLAPRDADVQNRLGEALERIGALDAAIDAFRRAIAERPAFRKADNNLILTLVKAGRGPEAIARARALVSAAPDDPDRIFTLGLAESEQDFAAAITTFRRVLQLDAETHPRPLQPRARPEARGSIAGGDRGAAARDRDRAASGSASTHLASSTGSRGTPNGRHARSGTLSAPTRATPDAHYTLGAVLAARNDWRGAADALRRAIALRPDLPGAHYSLARVLQQSGDAAAGASEFDEAERLRRRAQAEQEAGVWTAVGSRDARARRPHRRARSVPARNGGVRGLRAGALPDGPASCGASDSRRPPMRRFTGPHSSIPDSSLPPARSSALFCCLSSRDDSCITYRAHAVCR